MSQANVDLVRECIETFNSGDVQRLDELLDRVVAEGAVLRATGRLPELDGPLVGLGAIKTWFRQIDQGLHYRTEADEYIDAGDAVVVMCRQVGRGPESGIELSTPLVQVFGVRDGMVTYLDAYRTKAEALAALEHPA